jgi:hypothetical protein
MIPMQALERQQKAGSICDLHSETEEKVASNPVRLMSAAASEILTLAQRIVVCKLGLAGAYHLELIVQF